MKFNFKKVFLSIPNTILQIFFVLMCICYDDFVIELNPSTQGKFAYIALVFVGVLFTLAQDVVFSSVFGSSRETTDDIKIESPISTGRKEKEK